MMHLDAGYTPQEVKNILSSYLHDPKHGERNRPSTNIFYQGKAYTYGKLEVESPSIRKRIKPGVSSTTEGTKTVFYINFYIKYKFFEK